VALEFVSPDFSTDTMRSAKRFDPTANPLKTKSFLASMVNYIIGMRRLYEMDKGRALIVRYAICRS
jgi:hypothetical protein